MAEAARRRRAEFPSKADALLRYASKTPLRVLNAGALAAYVEHGFEDLPDGTARLKLAPAHEAAVFEASGAADLSTLQDIDIPVAVAAGEAEGGAGPAMWAPAVAAALVNGRLLTFEHLGHFGPLEHPHTIGSSVRAFLAEVS
jgi:pimeloyl-ACP methyl ester carboxylesterase